MNYRRIWETANNSCLLPWIDVHHINGNRQDNRLENLMPVTLQEQFDIHRSQGDYGACQAILFRMENKNEEEMRQIAKELASKHQLSLVEKGKHNFQKVTKEQRIKMSREAGYRTLNEKKGIHLLNLDPVRHKMVSSEAGKKSRDLKKEFHDQPRMDIIM